VALAGIVTEAGTLAALLLHESVTIVVLSLALSLIFTVPIEVFPPSSEVGLSVIDTNKLSTTVSSAVWVVPNVAEIVA
jgi:hypothetical protein